MVITKRTNNWLVLEQVWLGSDLTLIRLLQFLDYTTSAWRFWTLQQFKLQDQLIIYHLWCNCGQCVHQNLAFQCSVFPWPFNNLKYFSSIQNLSSTILYHINVSSEKYFSLTILYHLIFLLGLLRPCNISCWPFDTMQYFSLIQCFSSIQYFSRKQYFFFTQYFSSIQYFALPFSMACNICIQYNISSWVS